MRPRNRKPTTFKLYALLTLTIICLCLCVTQYVILADSNPAPAEGEGKPEFTLSMEEDTSLTKSRNGSHMRRPLGNKFWRTHDISLANHPLYEDDALPGTLSLTAVMPVTSASISQLERRLRTILDHSDHLFEIILVPPPSLQTDCRRALLFALSSHDHPPHVEFSVSPSTAGTDNDTALLQTAARATTPFALILGEDGLEMVDDRARDALTLLTPFSFAVPIGPRGMDHRGTEPACLSSSEVPQPAGFLVPPFVALTALLDLISYERDETSNVWQTLGDLTAKVQSDGVGGFVVGSDVMASGWCRQLGTLEVVNLEVNEEAFEDQVTPVNGVCPASSGSLAIVLSSLAELGSFSAAACRLKENGNSLHIALYAEQSAPGDNNARSASNLEASGCSLNYKVLSGVVAESTHAAMVLEWYETQAFAADVVITSLVLDSSAISTISLHKNSVIPTVISLPTSDLPYCDWMGSLTLEELRNWHRPQVEISVITNDRPHSLSRLLGSLSSGLYYGDSLPIRINLEQTADQETQHMVEDFVWPRGTVFLHRRVIHGGLLPAVVESWYPRSNDSYGLILEDDVELSPFFYAWIKLTLLRYRYGRSEDESAQLFGISLYQQKHLELRPEGRHIFDARDTFQSIGLADPFTPYLSQIPCSWGAVYFPEHWREFHAYLSFRLSEYAWDSDQVVVPGVRSNKWTRSWKKYFIELAYLRGYVMLYPNYANYVSLSTNHLEVGSHVKDVPRETYLRKKRLFLLPLMTLSATIERSRTGLLDLPDKQLPPWTELPSLDLLGVPASDETMRQRGNVRRVELTGCDDPTITMYDIRELLCLRDPARSVVN